VGVGVVAATKILSKKTSCCGEPLIETRPSVPRVIGDTASAIVAEGAMVEYCPHKLIGN